MTTAPIQLSMIPAPDVVETLDVETVFGQMRARLLDLAPELGAVLTLESDPIVKLLQICAYRETLLRARINDAARAVMLATALGSDLDHLAALLGVSRLIVTPADPDAVPPVVEVRESDEVLRARAQMAVEGFSTAGPAGAYEFHARSASSAVEDAAVASPAPGTVRVTVLTRAGSNAAAVVGQVHAALTADRVRPLCDTVVVQAATVVDYTLRATVHPFAGPDALVVLAQARAALDRTLASSRRIGRDITRSAIFAALHQPGVARVVLTAPAQDVPVGPTEVGRATLVDVQLGAAE